MDSDCSDANLLQVLHAQTGLVCLVGAGGKKTTLYRLALMHSGRVGLTSTVLIHPFPKLPAAEIITDEATIVPAVIKAAAMRRMVAFALTSTKHERLGGLSCAQVAHIHAVASFDVTLIKADGARGRRIKAPGANEPQIPEGTSTVIPVVSTRAIGKRLTERVAHRIERITAVTGARPGEIITSEHVARLLASEQGSLKNAGDAAIVPLINMVDNAELEVVAREAACKALELCEGRFGRVVLTSMRRVDPVVAVIER